MSRRPNHLSDGPPRPLAPRDLFDRTSHGTIVAVSMRLSSVSFKFTERGDPWGVLEGVWFGHWLRFPVFPSTWAQVSVPAPGDDVAIDGILLFRDGEPVICVRHLTRRRPVSEPTATS